MQRFDLPHNRGQSRENVLSAGRGTAQSRDERWARLRHLNDALRRYGRGGTICITAGIQALEAGRLAEVFAAVRDFDAFSADNGPYGEHDFATFKVGGLRPMWKIDYYDRERRFGSPDAADPAVTSRVLTIMLAAVY